MFLYYSSYRPGKAFSAALSLRDLGPLGPLEQAAHFGRLSFAAFWVVLLDRGKLEMAFTGKIARVTLT